jgi:diguanylate cyclase (GGDEF)-like protein
VIETTTIKVLLVEDNPGDAFLVRMLLEEVGADKLELTEAGLLGEALERLVEEDFGVVLLDLSLPDSQGLDTVNQVRVVAPEAPIVVLSGLDDEEMALQALQSGAQDYLVKGQGDGDLIARSIRYAIERKKAEERLAYLAQYDHLTGLANRALFQDRLEQALARAERSGYMVALMFLDLDRFKAVNDTLGHAAGDTLLETVARRIEERVRESDTVARLGGDEFAIILEDLSDARDAFPVARKILDIVSEPIVLDGHEIPMVASLGVAVRPPSEGNRLLKDADAAMYRAKRRGGNNYQFYTEEMNVQASARLALERDLRRALDREEFLLHYQPQVDLRTGHIAGAEALLRWRHPDRGLVSPAEFIPVLEDTGDIVKVGEWVMRTAYAQAKTWEEVGLAPLRMAVNLSARQFSQGDLVGTVVGILEETELVPYCLELEVTESLLMEDIQASTRMLNELKTVVGGLRISIDDFGTGYSSLYYLKSFPIDLLKIDQSFVRNIATDPDDAILVAAMIRLAHDLGIEVIAEGVETVEQLEYLRERGCDEVQGFYCGRPLPPDEFVKLLERGGPLLGVSS